MSSVTQVKAKPRSTTGKEKPSAVLNATTGKSFSVVPLDPVILRILALAQAMCERKWYPYQVQFTYRLVESILLRDGETVTALLARQSGKTEGLAGVIVALLVMMPILAKKYPNDWRFNLTDESGRYRGFKLGIRIGIYAPKVAQAEIMFGRVKAFFDTKTSKKVLHEMNVTLETSNGDTLRLSTGSRLLCQTASENAKIEGQTHDLLILEEAQDISDKKIKKSLNPMVASTKGTIVMIGTATTQRCSFYETIKINERSELSGRRRNHFFYPHEICAKYNSLYRDYVDQEKIKIGENSDEFQMSYACKWIFERGMFVTQQQLFHRSIALGASEIFSRTWEPHQAMSLPANVQLVAGIDWGRDHDSTVVTIVAVDWLNPLQTVSTHTTMGLHNVELYQKHTLAWKEWVGDNYEYQFEEIRRYLNSWGQRLQKVVTDANTAGKPIYDRLVAAFMSSNVEIVPFNFSSKLKSDGYKALYGEICGRRITFPADGVLVRGTTEYRKFINQMLDLRKSYKNGLMVVAHPDEKHAHDDYPDSLMLANWGSLIPPTVAEVDFAENNFFYR